LGKVLNRLRVLAALEVNRLGIKDRPRTMKIRHLIMGNSRHHGWSRPIMQALRLGSKLVHGHKGLKVSVVIGQWHPPLTCKGHANQ
jgi:hypothetical protein